MRCRYLHQPLVLHRSSMTTCAARSTSTRPEGSHAEPTDGGKAFGHAAVGYGRGSEGPGTGSLGKRVELPGTTLTAGRSAIELAGEPISDTYHRGRFLRSSPTNSPHSAIDCHIAWSQTGILHTPPVYLNADGSTTTPAL